MNRIEPTITSMNYRIEDINDQGGTPTTKTRGPGRLSATFTFDLAPSCCFPENPGSDSPGRANGAIWPAHYIRGGRYKKRDLIGAAGGASRSRLAHGNNWRPCRFCRGSDDRGESWPPDVARPHTSTAREVQTNSTGASPAVFVSASGARARGPQIVGGGVGEFNPCQPIQVDVRGPRGERGDVQTRTWFTR